MNRYFGACLAAALAASLVTTSRADEKEALAAVDKAGAALGEEKLAKAAGVSWKTKGVLTLGGNENEITGKATYAGIDKVRNEFSAEINGMAVDGVTVVDGVKGWRKFNDNLMEMDDEALANEKRNMYMAAAASRPSILKGKGFKVDSAPGVDVAGKPTVGVKVVGPDGKPFTLYLDKETGLPTQLAAKVRGFGGEDVDQVTTYSDYKDFGGVKRYTKTLSTRDGDKFIEATLSDFQILEKIEPGTFAEPK